MEIKTFWKSICALVPALLIVMAFFRGPQSQWLVIGVIGLWAAFIALVLFKSLLSKIFRGLGAFLVKITRSKRDGQADVSQLIVENRELKIALTNQIVMRIKENLNHCYPTADWKWAEKNPLERILNQETCRITISNIKDFNFADVQIDAKGALNFEFGKKVTLEEIKLTAKEEKSEAKETHTAEDWFHAEGSKVLNNIICELNAAGHSKFFISKTGEISIIDEGKSKILETELNMPAITLGKLKQLLKTIRLSSEIDGDKLAVSV